MLKAVLFDMDRVIVDTEPEYVRVESEMCSRVGIHCDAETKKKFVGSGTLSMWTNMKKEYGFAESAREMADEEERIMRGFYEQGELSPIRATIDFLVECGKNGIKIAVATSSVTENAEAVVKRLGLQSYVPVLVGGDMVRHPKTAPDIFLTAADKLAVRPDECVVVEDSANGIAAAKKAGMTALGFKSPDNGQDMSEADIVVSSLFETSVEKLRSFLKDD